MAIEACPETRGTDPLLIEGTDFIELYVGNARQASLYYRAALGFRLIAHRGPETGCRDRVSYVLAQGQVRLVLTAPLGPEGPIAEHIRLHGDGVKDLALRVGDVREAWSRAVERGGTSVRAPETLADADGEIAVAAIQTYGETIHSLVERRSYEGLFLPGFAPLESRYNPSPAGITHVDHCVGNVEAGRMDEWVRFYEDVLGFHGLISFADGSISTERSALMSKVVANDNGRVKFPLNEPARGRSPSQIDEYLGFYRGAGCQHIALASDDIVATVSALRDRGVELLDVPPGYHDTALDRVGPIDEDVAALRELGILVDRDDDGYLLQIFTRPVQDRPTLFYEIIQRKGAKSFGAGNFKALFEAIEREQARRGNL
jgi:4-hydroxyphenylpyruvate dioxygenase